MDNSILIESQEREHSTLSASSSHRWLNCTKSVKFTEGMKDEGSSYAEEGTRAHELCAWKVAELFKVPGVKKPDYTYDAATEECADSYAAFVSEKMEKNAAIFLEQRVDYSEYTAPGSFGTADCVIVAGDTLKIIDYKHGVGVPVSCENNPQLMLYALGAYDALKDLYDIKHIEMSIFQPRISNISTYGIELEALLGAAEKEFKPKAQEAIADSGSFCAGEWCRFCKGKNICRERAKANLALAREDFALPPELSNAEVAEILTKVDQIIAWCTDIKDYALDSALKGESFQGFKLVYGRSIRKYSDKDKVAEIVKAEGLDPYQHKVLGITDMTKLLGKKKFEELLAGLVIKPEGKPTLVPESDKRPAMAQSDFSEFTQS